MKTRMLLLFALGAIAFSNAYAGSNPVNNVKITKIARDASGAITSSTTIKVKVVVNDGTTIYTENFTDVSVNDLGFFSVEIGSGNPEGTTDLGELTINNGTTVQTYIGTTTADRLIAENKYLDVAANTAPFAQGNTAVSGNVSAQSLVLSTSNASNSTDLSTHTSGIISVNGGQNIATLPPATTDGKTLYIVNTGATTVTLPNTLGIIQTSKVAALVSIGGNWYRDNKVLVD